MLYEKDREIARESFEEWVSEEVFSFGWFLILGILIVTYIVWLKLVDKRRGTQLLLSCALLYSPSSL